MPNACFELGFLTALALTTGVLGQEVKNVPATQSRAKPPQNESAPTPLVAKADAELDLDDTEQALAFGRLLANIENSAIDVLNRRARGEEISPEVAGRAAGLLAAVGTNREEAIKALCDNLDLVPPQQVSSLSPLLGFKAANALIRIGSPLAFQGLLDNLKGPLPRKELLIIAHVMRRMDDPRVVATRNKVAFEDAPAGEAGATYRANLREIQRLLNSPEELNDRKNWPLLMDFTKRQGSME